MIALFFTIGVMLVLFLLVSSYKPRGIDTTSIDPYLYLAKLHYSPDLINVVEPATQVVRTGVIDPERLRRINEYDVYPGDKDAEFVGARILLHDKDLHTIVDVIHNLDVYGQLSGFATAGVKMAGGAQRTDFFLPIVYISSGKELRGYLNMTVVTPHGWTSNPKVTS